MATIAVLSQKGGCGKTTISTQLCKAFQLMGKSVLLVDSDPQGSARDWAAANEGQTIPVVGIDRPSLERDIKPISKNVDIIIIDGAPRHEQIMAAAIRVADFVLIPVQPSPLDVWATAELARVIVERQKLLGGPKAAFVMSRVINRTKIDREVREALDELRLPALTAFTSQRVSYPNASAKGLTVLDVAPKSAASLEIKEIARQILEMMAAPLVIRPEAVEGVAA